MLDKASNIQGTLAAIRCFQGCESFAEGSLSYLAQKKKGEAVIQSIVFDLGGVLLDDPAAGMIRYYANRLQVDREALVEAFNRLWEAWHKGSLSEQELWEQVTADLKPRSLPEESLWLDGFKQVYREKPEMFALVRRLKHQGYTIALLSNIELPIVRYLRQQPFKDIDLCFYSCEMGVSKPEKAIYEKMLQGLGCQPQEAIFIDDRRANVDGAASVGITSIVFRGCDELIKQLRRLGINL